MKITQRDLKNYVRKMLRFIESDEPTPLNLNEKDYHIMAITTMMYEDDQEDEGLQWGMALIVSAMDKCFQDVNNFMDFLKKAEKDLRD